MCRTHRLVSGSSAILVLLRNVLHGPIQDRRHPIEQSLRKWLGCSEYPEVFGILLEGGASEASSETKKP